MEHTVPLILQWDETFDIGADTGTPVDDRDYPVPFAFTGKIDKLTIALDRPKLISEDEKKLAEAARNAIDTGAAPAPKVESYVKKLEACRDKAKSAKQDDIERLQFIVECLRG